MNYYEFHIGDFNAATRHLTRVERSIYRDMIDMYYDTEKPLPLDLKILNRKLIARTEEEQEAVLVVLDEFFIKTESGYFNSRCDEVIQKYHSNTTAKSEAGKASAAKKEQARLERLAQLNGVSTEAQQKSTAVQQPLDSVSTEVQPIPTNHKPITNNQEPINTHSNARENFDDFLPDLEMLNTKLHNAGGKPISQEKLEQTLVTFLPHYETHQLTKNQLMGKLVTWIMRDSQAKNHKSGGSVSKIPDNNTTDWVTPELAAMLEAQIEYAN